MHATCPTHHTLLHLISVTKLLEECLLNYLFLKRKKQRQFTLPQMVQSTGMCFSDKIVLEKEFL